MLCYCESSIHSRIESCQCLVASSRKSLHIITLSKLLKIINDIFSWKSMKLKLHFLNSLPCVLGFACMLWLMNAISYGNRKQLRISTKIPFFSLLKHSVYNIFFTRLSSVPVNSSVTGLEWPNGVCVDFTMLILDKQLLLVTAEKNIVYFKSHLYVTWTSFFC